MLVTKKEKMVKKSRLASGAKFLVNLGVVMGVVCMLAACASTSQARKTTTSGFLKDYSQLKPGGEGQAQLLYIDPAAKFSAYNAILMEPITVYATSADSALAKVPEEEMEELLNYLDVTVREQLSSDYKLVTQPGPGVMRLRIALTEAQGAKVGLNAISSVTPTGLALSGLKKAVTGKSTGVGATRAEMEILDAQSGKRLAAAVDERVGGKTSSFSKWQSAKDAFDYWAQRLKARLAEFRAE